MVDSGPWPGPAERMITELAIMIIRGPASCLGGLITGSPAAGFTGTEQRTAHV